MTERLCEHYPRNQGIETRTVRFRSLFGPKGTWVGGREKATATLCRKLGLAKPAANQEIEIWGDGDHARSICDIDDCVRGIDAPIRSGDSEPLNLGQDRLVSINELADLVVEIAGVPMPPATRPSDPRAPSGAGRPPRVPRGKE